MLLAMADIGWSELGAITGIVATVTAAANTWLRVQMRSYIDRSTEKVLAQIRIEYPLKEVTDVRLADLQRRVSALESENRAKKG